MGAIPGEIQTGQQPPMTIPLRHFVVGIGFLFGGGLLGVGLTTGLVSPHGTVAHVHLLLVGWICITIMGAMTQFVPVWSGVALHSRRLANLQLGLVGIGLSGFVAGLLLEALLWVIPSGGLVLAGFWAFIYNIGRTMAGIETHDVTTRHFLWALGFFAIVTTLGFLLAVGLTRPLFPNTVLSRADVVDAHATVAVFGAILTTVYGALYQLGTMFTQTELHGIDEVLRLIEEVCHPVGVLLLALGRLTDAVLVGRVGAGVVLVAAVAFGAILARKLAEMRVDRTPMHTRYGVAVSALLCWALVTAPAWLRAPTAPEHLFGAPGAVHLFTLGVIGFVVVGTLYHIVPFTIWVQQYSDRLGFEAVPMVDDLYDGRLAATDATLLVTGTVVLVAAEWFRLPGAARGLGGGLVLLGSIVFGANTLLVIRGHSPHSVGRLLLVSLDRRDDAASADGGAVNESSR